MPTTLRIIDFVAGYKGTTQDSRAFAASDVVKNSEVYLDDGDFIWVDGGYGYSTFTCGPYDHITAAKSPDFRTYNYHVSNVRVRSEHGFGYLKGRFQSLRGMRMLLRDDKDHIQLVKTVVAMLVAHNLALRWDGDEERNVFVDVSALSNEARRVWTHLQHTNEEQAAIEADARAQRIQAHERRRAETASQPSRSQHAQDLARRSRGKGLREELHVALFRALGYDFADTTSESRQMEKTEEELRKYRQEKADKAARARERRRMERANGRGDH